jgi:hypothetical protein
MRATVRASPPKSTASERVKAGAPPSRLTPLNRREFFRLTERCREYALELAHYDQSRVDLAQCHKFNTWLPELKSFDLLGPALRTLPPARPVARWQVMVLAGSMGLLLFFVFSARGVSWPGFSFFYLISLFVLYFVPERLYGTTIELLEGKLLRVVDALDKLLLHGDLGFTEAAFFQARDNLEAARRELRQQIDLAHR